MLNTYEFSMCMDEVSILLEKAIDNMEKAAKIQIMGDYDAASKDMAVSAIVLEMKRHDLEVILCEASARARQLHAMARDIEGTK